MVDEYYIHYEGKSIFHETSPASGDDPDIRSIYVESGTNLSFRDSLIITENYNQGKKIIAFSQDSIAALETQ
jgi:hypothetical protein